MITEQEIIDFYKSLHGDIIAAPCDHADIAEYLQKFGADINIINEAGEDAFFIAVKDGKNNILEIFKKHNPDKFRELINKKYGTNELTALMVAADNNHDKIVELLLESDADISITNEAGEDAFYVATKNKNILEIFKKHDYNKFREFLNKKYGRGQLTALMKAATRGYADSAEYLLESGADINITGLFGDAFSMAVEYSRKNVLEIFKKHNLDKFKELLNKIKPGESSVLIGAAQRNHIETLMYLIEAGSVIGDIPDFPPIKEKIRQDCFEPAQIADAIFNKKNNDDLFAKLPDFSDVKLSLIKERLKSLALMYGIPSSIDYFIESSSLGIEQKKLFIDYFNEIKTSDQKIVDLIEACLAEILYKHNSELFPSPIPYSQLEEKKYSNYIKKEIIDQLQSSYENNSYLIPINFFNYMIEPKNQEEMIKFFAKYHNLGGAQHMLSNLNDIIIDRDQLIKLRELKSKYDQDLSPIAKDLISALYLSSNQQQQEIDRLKQQIQQSPLEREEQKHKELLEKDGNDFQQSKITKWVKIVKSEKRKESNEKEEREGKKAKTDEIDVNSSLISQHHHLDVKDIKDDMEIDIPERLKEEKKNNKRLGSEEIWSNMLSLSEGGFAEKLKESRKKAKSELIKLC